jgi:pyruvate dehydrogenase E2 component (dihydrolipoyllysine-residue acetyltransferase)
MDADRRALTLTPMRAAIGRRMSDSKTSIPHFYVSTDMQMDNVLDAAERINAGRAREDRVTITAFILKALAVTLGEHPHFNAVWEGGIPHVVAAINISVAVAVDGGLLAPAILSCESLDVEELSVRIRDVAARARAGRIRAAEAEAGTFTLTNLGGFDVSAFAAIITPPQVAILATSRITPRPVVSDGAIVIRNVMTATLSADHRVVDGAAAGQFLQDLHVQLRKAARSDRAADAV